MAMEWASLKYIRIFKYEIKKKATQQLHVRLIIKTLKNEYQTLTCLFTVLDSLN